MRRRERSSERWQALGVGPQRKIKKLTEGPGGLYVGFTPASLRYSVIVRA